MCASYLRRATRHGHAGRCYSASRMGGSLMAADVMSVEKILAKLASVVSRIAQARYEFGIAVLLLIEQHGYSRDEAAKRIRQALPDYQVKTGYALTKSWLLASADRILAMRAIGGIPDGKGEFIVPTEDFVNSPIPDALAKRVAILTGSNPAKGPGVLRGTDVRQALDAAANAKNDDALAKAINALEAKVSKVEHARAMLDNGERGELELKVKLAREKLAKAEAAVRRAQDQLKAAKEALAKHDAAEAEAQAKAEAPQASRKRASRRTTSTAQVQQVAQG